MRSLLPLLLSLLTLCGCTSSPSRSYNYNTMNPMPPSNSPSNWAIALHGGAGTLDKNVPKELIAAYETSLNKALAEGIKRLEAGQPALDVVQAVVSMLEDDELFNAGRGAALTAAGTVELDAAIMDGSNFKCGAVASVKTVKNPIALARLVMTQTNHILLAAQGAEDCATAQDVTRVPNESFITPRRQKMLEEWRKEQAGKTTAASSEPDHAAPNPSRFGTVGCVVRDTAGNLAAATSTGGLTGKKFGRIGDAPLIGSGTYAANATCAVSCTGTGEQFIRHGVARMVAARMELMHETVAQAADYLVTKTLSPDDGGLIAIDAAGNIAMPYNSEGMYRAAADSSGMKIVKIWQ